MLFGNTVIAELSEAEKLAAFRRGHDALMRFGARYRADEAFRARIESGDYDGFRDAFRSVFPTVSGGGALPGETEIRVVSQTPDVFYFPLPADPCKLMSDEELAMVAGGVGTYIPDAATAASVLTSNCAAGSFSSQSSLGPDNLL